MLTFSILVLAVLLLLSILLTMGGTILAVFSDLIVCVLIIIGIVKLIQKIRKK